MQPLSPILLANLRLTAHVYVSYDLHNKHWFFTATVLTGWYRGADKSLARPGRKQAIATEDFEFHVPYV